jgi:hypothetical protein
MQLTCIGLLGYPAEAPMEIVCMPASVRSIPATFWTLAG